MESMATHNYEIDESDDTILLQVEDGIAFSSGLADSPLPIHPFSSTLVLGSTLYDPNRPQVALAALLMKAQGLPVQRLVAWPVRLAVVPPTQYTT